MNCNELLEEWSDPLGVREMSDAEPIIDLLRSALALLKEDMETIDRMPFESLEEAADFAEGSLNKHKEFMGAA